MFLCSFRSRLENETLCKIISSGEIQDLEFDVVGEYNLHCHFHAHVNKSSLEC